MRYAPVLAPLPRNFATSFLRRKVINHVIALLRDAWAISSLVYPGDEEPPHSGVNVSAKMMLSSL
jgi:hypothetical protein